MKRTMKKMDKKLTYRQWYRKCTIKNAILGVCIIIVSAFIYFTNNNNTKIERENKNALASVTTTATPTPKPTLEPTPTPTPIIMVKEKYKKGKILQDHTVYHWSDSNRNINLKNAAKALNGTKIMPQEKFSFYGVLGEPTEEKGYVYAGSLENGKSVQTVGGGICENATSLNTVIVDAGITTYGKKEHSANVGYLNETDHEVTVTYGQLDLTFTNTLRYPLLIKQKVVGGNVRTLLYKMQKIYIVTIKDVITGKKKIKKYSEKNMPKKYRQFIPEY